MTAEITTVATEQGNEVAESTTVENAAPTMTGAEARAARLNRKRQNAAVAAQPRPITPAPKPGKGKGKASADADPEAGMSPAQIEAKRLKDEAAAKKIADKAERDQKREQRKAEQEQAKAQRDAARKQREEAKEQREREREAAKAALHAILGTNQYKSVDRDVPTATFATHQEVMTANPSKGFVASVKDHGILEPIILLARTAEDAESVTDLGLAGGRRRLAAALENKMPEIPARVYIVGDDFDRLLDGLTIHLNAAREDNVLADVRAIERLRNPDRVGGALTIEQISRELMMPIGTVKKRAKLLSLPTWLREAWYGGALGHSIVQEVSGQSAEALEKFEEIYTRTGTITHADVKAVRAAIKGESLDVDAAADGPDAGATQRRAGVLRADLSLDSAVLAFMRESLSASGVGFEVDGTTGKITITRGNEVVTFEAAYEAGEGGDVPPAE